MMVYFQPGEVVKLKQDIPNIPEMIVKSVPKMKQAADPKKDSKLQRKSILLGVKCFWFTDNGFYQEFTFNTKDLEKVKSNA